jgi:hypothetical protein
MFIWFVRMRASVSVGPPAGYGTTIVIGRDGKVSALVVAMLAASKPSAIERRFFTHPRRLLLPVAKFSVVKTLYLPLIGRSLASMIEAEAGMLIEETIAKIRRGSCPG